MSKGIYIHAPFCLRKCPYCDFYSAPGDDETKGAYVKALLRAIALSPDAAEADTLYFGGGTPVLLGERALCEVLSAASERFSLPSGGEYTVEANPGAVTRAMLESLHAGGFNRISFGVQALDDGLLQTLGRIHSGAEALAAIDTAYAAGFLHISADLMLAVPGQTPGHIRDAVSRLAETPIDHLSMYLLQIEEGTPFYGTVAEPAEDFAVACYETACDAARQAGFTQYEISNFARDVSARSRHNLHYWRDEEYLGIGPAAHSFLSGERFYFPRDRESFIAAENPWTLTVSDGTGGDEEEKILLGLRLSEGVALCSLSPGTRKRVEEHALPLIESGFLRTENGRLMLTRSALTVSNTVIAELI